MTLNAQIYPDTDNDGITDNIDEDDDNDGILDTVEQAFCLTSPNATVVETVFLNETFGSGITRTRINGTTPGVSTSYCFEDGTTAQAPDECNTNIHLGDGKYTVHHMITTGVNGEPIGPNNAVSSWAYYAWAPAQDHTPGDTNGRMAIFNASFAPGVFYETQITGLLPGVPISYSFWAMNIDNADAAFIAVEGAGSVPRILPNITVNFLTTDLSTVLFSFDTGDITRCSGAINDPNDPGYNPADPNFNMCSISEWKQFTQSFTVSASEFVVQFVNNAPGGRGNDLAIDDIRITQTLCDSDGDGVADILDLDNDNDGIPNIIEAQMIANPDPDLDATTFGPTWVDVNNNGVHDLFEGQTAIDTDGDGIPDYLDLDSDNDGIFDALEHDGFGDVDIDGDGAGDGSDANSGIADDEFDGDGILGTIDGNDNDADANDHGSSGYSPPLDTDGDGIPDYLDVYNNVTGVFDIATTLYSHLDANNDGIIDGTLDTDMDGILDAFDTDNNHFGSPRDLNGKFALYFDGRNDYVEEQADIVLGLASATLMAWVKLDTDFADAGAIVGQNNFYLRANSTRRLRVEINGASYSAPATNLLPLNQWAHVAAIYNGADADQTVKLYINGVLIGSTNTLTMQGGIVNSANKNFRIGRNPSSTIPSTGEFFKGMIEEVRVFNTALSEDELKKMVYQELNESNFNQGTVIPQQISGTLSTSLVRYYRMDAYKNDILDDVTTAPIDETTGAKLYNIKHIYPQTAPLPYETVSNGDWSSPSTWAHGDIWDITDEPNNSPFSIVRINNTVTTSFSHETLGLEVSPSAELIVNADEELRNTWYVKLDGQIDLEGEAQFVQTENSVLDVNSAGTLERDQQGTADRYTYNYWAFPVGVTSTTSNNTVSRVNRLRDNAGLLQFTTGVNPPAAQTSPITISSRWLYKFANRPTGEYSEWQHIGANGDLNPGEGFSMKGSGTGSVGDEQNYVFNGKPYNGDVNITVNSGNQYLVGNPYASALDAYQFIDDNTGVTNSNESITGTLYFWDHFGGSTHNLNGYQGGYAMLTKLGGVAAMAHPDVSQAQLSGSKIPQQFIPVGQGFFVTADVDGGSINFNNTQRTFATEASSNSLFLKPAKTESKSVSSKSVQKQNRAVGQQAVQESTIPKIWLGFKDSNGYHRQLLVGFTENATPSYDKGYDGLMPDKWKNDIYWKVNNEDFAIQGYSDFNEEITLSLEAKITDAGPVTFQIDKTENFDLEQPVFLKDKLTGTYHNLLQGEFITTLVPGTMANRFVIVFKTDETLGSQDAIIASDVFATFKNTTGELVISNHKSRSLGQVKLINMLGQEIFKKTLNTNQTTVKLPVNLAPGTYVAAIEADKMVVTKKIVKN